MSYPVYNGLPVAGPSALQWAGVGVAAIGFPIALVSGISLTGYAIGAALYLANFLIALAIDLVARGQGEVTAMGITSMAFMMRAFATVGLLFLTNYAAGRTVAITAAIVFLVLFSIGLTVRAFGAMVARSQAMEGSA